MFLLELSNAAFPYLNAVLIKYARVLSYAEAGIIEFAYCLISK